MGGSGRFFEEGGDGGRSRRDFSGVFCSVCGEMFVGFTTEQSSASSLLPPSSVFGSPLFGPLFWRCCTDTNEVGCHGQRCRSGSRVKFAHLGGIRLKCLTMREGGCPIFGPIHSWLRQIESFEMTLTPTLITPTLITPTPTRGIQPACSKKPRVERA